MKALKKGLSYVVTSMILVLASIIVALVLVGFTFGLFASLGGTPTVTPIGTGVITPVVENGQVVYYQANFTLKSTGTVQIVSVTLEGVQGKIVSSSTLNSGYNNVVVDFPASLDLQQGSFYKISVALQDSETVQVAAEVEGSTFL